MNLTIIPIIKQSIIHLFIPYPIFPPSLTEPKNGISIYNMEHFTKIALSGLPFFITEAQIVQELKKFGSIQFVRLKKSKSSCCCIVNFLDSDSASKAKSNLNGKVFLNKRVQVYFPDCFPIKDPNTNLFIKKIPVNCDVQQVEEVFKSFGCILNSKISYDETGSSLGYGFLMFASKESVDSILQHKHEFFLARCKLEVESFVPKTSRPCVSCNVYIRGFPESYSKDQLVVKFKAFGEIQSSIISYNSGQPFGFISFKDSGSAEKAILAVDGQVSEGIFWFVKRSLNRSDRLMNLKLKKIEIEEKWQKQNLYVKNWPSDLNEDQFRAVFERFGTIESVKFVTKECLTLLYSYPMTEIKPTGQVFLCYQNEKAAELAIMHMRHVLVNNTILKIYRWVPKHSLKKPKGIKVYNKENLQRNESKFVNGKKTKAEFKDPFENTSQPVRYFDAERLGSAKGEERKRVFGEAIYREIFCKYGNVTGKITGMIIELEENELMPMMANKFSLYSKAKEAMAILNNSHVNSL